MSQVPDTTTALAVMEALAMEAIAAANKESPNTVNALRNVFAAHAAIVRKSITPVPVQEEPK